MRNEIWLDGDILVHRAAAAVQKDYKFAGPIPAIDADFGEALKIVDREILVLRRTLDAGSVKIALSDPDSSANWRKQVLPTYKFERTKRAKPVLFRQLRAELESRFETTWHPGLEGDDILGIAATTPGHPERVIVSIDKDLQGVPGRLYNPNKPEREIVATSRESADRFHLMQTLMGDPVDGYTGLVGIGPKKAAGILEAAPRQHSTHSATCACTSWDKVVRAYQKAGLTEEDALVQARVARILRHGEWNRHVGVKLWMPEEETK